MAQLNTSAQLRWCKVRLLHWWGITVHWSRLHRCHLVFRTASLRLSTAAYLRTSSPRCASGPYRSADAYSITGCKTKTVHWDNVDISSTVAHNLVNVWGLFRNLSDTFYHVYIMPCAPVGMGNGGGASVPKIEKLVSMNE